MHTEPPSGASMHPNDSSETDEARGQGTANARQSGHRIRNKRQHSGTKVSKRSASVDHAGSRP
eukprot:scaffold283536_cov18-Prasinocladus_malaysianus.AAC.1